MFLMQLFSNPQFFIYWISIIVFSICVHEFSHALAAYWQGDDTAKVAGFFTINPVVQMGKVSLICLLMFGMCWGACPVNPCRFKHRYSDALVAFAGPFSNFVLSVIFMIIGLYFSKYYSSSFFVKNFLNFCYVGAYSNATLGIFNLLPVPPLDGGKIAEYFFPNLTPLYERMGMYGLFILLMIFSFVPILNDILWGGGKVFMEIITIIYQSVSFFFHSVF